MSRPFKYRGSWRAQKTINKKRFSSPLFDTKKEADRWLAEVESKGGVIDNKIFSDIINIYIDKVAQFKRSATTFKIRCNLLKRQNFANKFIKDITPFDVSDFRDERLKIVGPATVLKDLAILSNIFKYSINEWGFCEVNPVSKIKKPSKPKHRERRITTKEKEMILEVLDFNPNQKIISNKKQLIGAFFCLALETALRIGEICTITAEDCFFDKKTLFLPITKNGHARNVPLNKTAINLIKMILESKLKTTTGQASSLFKKYRQATGIQDLTFHDTRHEAISQMAKIYNVLELAKIVGHRDHSNLMIYYNPTAEELASKMLN